MSRLSTISNLLLLLPFVVGAGQQQEGSSKNLRGGGTGTGNDNDRELQVTVPPTMENHLVTTLGREGIGGTYNLPNPSSLISTEFTIRLRFRVEAITSSDRFFDIVQFDEPFRYFLDPPDPPSSNVEIDYPASNVGEIRISPTDGTKGTVQMRSFTTIDFPTTDMDPELEIGAGSSDDVIEWTNFNEVVITRNIHKAVYVWVNGKSAKGGQSDQGEQIYNPIWTETTSDFFRTLPNTVMTFFNGANVEFDYIEIYNAPMTIDELPPRA